MSESTLSKVLTPLGNTLKLQCILQVVISAKYFFYHTIQEKTRIECVQEFRQHQNITTKKHTKSKSQVSLLLPAVKAARNYSNITQFHLEIKDKKHQESQSYHPKYRSPSLTNYFKPLKLVNLNVFNTLY